MRYSLSESNVASPVICMVLGEKKPGVVKVGVGLERFGKNVGSVGF